MAKLIPLYKSGSLAEIDNYRPISILPTLSKILEKIVYKQLMAHLERHSLLFEYQFGFRPSRSTELAVTYFTDLIRKEADNMVRQQEQFSLTYQRHSTPSVIPFY